MYILGISCFKNNSAACLLYNGHVLSAVQEERFSRKKFDSSFPLNSVSYCLEEAKIDIKKLDYVGFYNDMPRDMARLRAYLKKFGYRKEIITFNLKDSYLAAAFYPSPFIKAAVFINGDKDVGMILGQAKGSKIELIKDYSYSLANMYSGVTDYLGFNPGIDDYKVMGLAAYGRPQYKNAIIKNKTKLIGASYQKSRLILKKICNAPARKPHQEITRQHMDIASSVQEALQDEVLKVIRTLHKITGLKDLCLSGPLSLNCVANTKILEQGLFKRLWIQPAPDDAGCCLGAAYLVWNRQLKHKRKISQDAMHNGYLGPSYSDAYIEQFLRKQKITYRKYSYRDIPKITAGLIMQDRIVGWFQGRLEFGPRALGARSILANARNISMHDRINAYVKFREPFRPLAPAVLKEYQKDYFDLAADSPYMLLIAKARKRNSKNIPAVVHVDGSSRIQTVTKEANQVYYNVIKEFYRKTGCPVIINTSFNRKDEPIVLSPKDAYNCFKATAMDCLIMGNLLIRKKR